MNTKKELSRITIDIPKVDHKKLKAIAAVLGKTMREIIIESIEEHLHSIKIPNKKTLKAIADIEAGKGLTRTKNAKDLFKKLGI
jgi:antitoxin component of RelBE/YafQ-DinJ toxin-antitoxin module